MKRFLAIILALALMLSCAAALAAPHKKSLGKPILYSFLK